MVEQKGVKLIPHVEGFCYCYGGALCCEAAYDISEFNAHPVRLIKFHDYSLTFTFSDYPGRECCIQKQGGTRGGNRLDLMGATGTRRRYEEVVELYLEVDRTYSVKEREARDRLINQMEASPGFRVGFAQAAY